LENLKLEPIDVYKQIAKDLLEALPDLPLVVPSNEYGRVTKAAAQVLMVCIYLYYEGYGKGVLGFSEDWSDGTTVIDKTMVRNAMDDIIANTGTTHYKLLDNYADIFAWDNENNEESIFEIQYAENSAVVNWSDYSVVNGNFASMIMSPRSPNGDTTVGAGWSFGMITWSLYNEFETGDPRLNTTVYNGFDSLTSFVVGYHNTGYFNHKYMARADYTSNAGDPQMNYAKNYIDVLYAEILLIAAELYLDIDNGHAAELLSEVRTRSMGPSSALTSITLDDIYHELRVEFGGEGHRYWDLLRRGLDYAKEKIDAGYIPDPLYPEPGEFQGYVFDKAHLGMLPIPAEEIRTANEGVLEQKIDFYKSY
jgi:hypothetical protein